MLEFIMAIALSSPVFAHDGPIPKLYTCQDKDISPALIWSGLPNGTKSVALIVDDPDATDREGEAIRLTAACTAELEAAIRRNPSEWVWMHERWRTAPPDPGPPVADPGGAPQAKVMPKNAALSGG